MVNALQDPGTLALLTFSRNDVDEVVRNVETLRQLVDEVVVVDSSFPAARSKLSQALRPPRERLCVAPPLGNVDLLRSFGVAQVTSDRVVLLDSDETLSPALRDALPELCHAEAYVIPRWESALRAFTHHLRVFQRRSVSYTGRSYDFPHVNGVTRVLPRRLHILHAAPGGRDYWASNDRARRYLLSEMLERPYDWNYLRQTLGLRAASPVIPEGVTGTQTRAGLSEPAVQLVLTFEAARTLLGSQSLGLAKFRLEQGRQRTAVWSALPAAEKRWIEDTGRQVQLAGGLVQFLGLDDPAYVERLNELLDPMLDGPDVLKFLLEIRAATGRVWSGDPSYPPTRAGGGTPSQSLAKTPPSSGVKS
jgi:hypothetical protein